MYVHGPVSIEPYRYEFIFITKHKYIILQEVMDRYNRTLNELHYLFSNSLWFFQLLIHSIWDICTLRTHVSSILLDKKCIHLWYLTKAKTQAENRSTLFYIITIWL